MKVEINGKGLLAIALLSTSLVVADFVSVANVKAAGGVKLIGATEEDIAEAITQAKLDMHPIGSVVLRMDNVDPATIYGGTWSKITGDAALRLGDGNSQSGSIVGGSNNPAVPLLSHSHGATFSGHQLPAHNHITYANGSDSDQHPNGGNYISGSSFWHGKSGDSGQYTGGASAGTPSGVVSISPSGSASATLDVRGKYITVNFWQRTS